MGEKKPVGSEKQQEKNKKHKSIISKQNKPKDKEEHTQMDLHDAGYLSIFFYFFYNKVN